MGQEDFLPKIGSVSRSRAKSLSFAQTAGHGARAIRPDPSRTHRGC